jgi:hypothetical protein
MPVVQIEAAVVFPADVGIVFAMMTDEGYVSRKATAMGALEHDVVVTRLPTGGAEITLARTLPAVVPDFVRPLVGETIDVVQTEHWAAADADGTRSGTLTAAISNAPVQLRGEISLTSTGASSALHRVDVNVKARVPLLGGRIEKAIGEVILMAARKEEEVGARWLADMR